MADIEGTNGQRTEFKAVGREDIPGRLSYSIATGMAKYGCDCVVPDMLHSKSLRNPYGHVKIKSIDISQARAVDGVVDIVTWDDPDVLAANPALVKPPVMTEDLIYDRSTGVKLSTNMFEYKKPAMLDMGPVETYAVETRGGNACYGATGISHCMATPLLPVCAVANAIGKWVEPPATPDKILKALGKG